MTKEEQHEALGLDLDRAEKAGFIMNRSIYSNLIMYNINTRVEMTFHKRRVLTDYLDKTYPDVKLNIHSDRICITIRT